MLQLRHVNAERLCAPAVQLPSNSLVSGSGALYGVLHVCAHGVLFPRTVWIGSARYYLNDPLRKKAPIGVCNGRIECRS